MIQPDAVIQVRQNSDSASPLPVIRYLAQVKREPESGTLTIRPHPRAHARLRPISVKIRPNQLPKLHRLLARETSHEACGDHNRKAAPKHSHYRGAAGRSAHAVHPPYAASQIRSFPSKLKRILLARRRGPARKSGLRADETGVTKRDRATSQTSSSLPRAQCGDTRLLLCRPTSLRAHAALYARLRGSPGTFAPRSPSTTATAPTTTLPCRSSPPITSRPLLHHHQLDRHPHRLHGLGHLRALHAAGHHIGAHGGHPRPAHPLHDRDLEKELYTARMLLEDKLGAPITTMSLPRRTIQPPRSAPPASRPATPTSTPRPQSRARSPQGRSIGRLNFRGDMDPTWIARPYPRATQRSANSAAATRSRPPRKRCIGDRLYAKLWAILNRNDHRPNGPS